MDLKKLIEENIQEVKDIWDRLHCNAELSFKEFKTQGIILEFFKGLGIKTQILANTGVVATLNEGDDCIAVRADMDALPVNGVSHACGHDYHMAVTLGTALLLKKMGCKKCIKFIFQPGEESEGGALPMIKQGVLENPTVKSMISFHVWPMVPVGKVEVTGGPSMASVDDFHVTFKGVGGHAAMPHLCKNPIYPALDFIESMNIKSRIEQNPLNSHIITFSSMQCGTAPNVIAHESKVLGTVRTFDNDLRNKLYEDIQNTVKLSAEKYGCSSEVDYSFQYPPLINDNDLSKKFIDLTKELIGEQNVLPLEKTFAAEDFSFFAEKVPSVHFRLGISDGVKGQHPLHSPNFDAAGDSLFYGLYITTNFLLNS